MPYNKPPTYIYKNCIQKIQHNRLLKIFRGFYLCIWNGLIQTNIKTDFSMQIYYAWPFENGKSSISVVLLFRSWKF